MKRCYTHSLTHTSLVKYMQTARLFFIPLPNIEASEVKDLHRYLNERTCKHARADTRLPSLASCPLPSRTLNEVDADVCERRTCTRTQLTSASLLQAALSRRFRRHERPLVAMSFKSTQSLIYLLYHLFICLSSNLFIPFAIIFKINSLSDYVAALQHVNNVQT